MLSRQRRNRRDTTWTRRTHTLGVVYRRSNGHRRVACPTPKKNCILPLVAQRGCVEGRDNGGRLLIIACGNLAQHDAAPGNRPCDRYGHLVRDFLSTLVAFSSFRRMSMSSGQQSLLWPRECHASATNRISHGPARTSRFSELPIRGGVQGAVCRGLRDSASFQTAAVWCNFLSNMARSARRQRTPPSSHKSRPLLQAP